MRSVLNVEERRIMPWTLYPLASSSSVKYEPSCPVIPVMSAHFAMREFRVSAECGLVDEGEGMHPGHPAYRALSSTLSVGIRVPSQIAFACPALLSQYRSGFKRIKWVTLFAAYCPPLSALDSTSHMSSCRYRTPLSRSHCSVWGR